MNLWYHVQRIGFEAMLLSRQMAQKLAPEGQILVLLALPGGNALCTLAICALVIEMPFGNALVWAAAAWAAYTMLVLVLAFSMSDAALQGRLDRIAQKLEIARTTRAHLVKLKELDAEQNRTLQEKLARDSAEARRTAHADELERAARAPGCQRCGGHNFKRWSRSSPAGTALIIGGLVASCFTCGVALILVVIGACLKDQGWRCENCGYEWRS